MDEKVTIRNNGIFYSPFQGRQTQIKNKSLIIEETNQAKYYIIDSTGVVKGKFYIPYYSDDSKAMNPTWARIYLKNNNKYIFAKLSAKQRNYS